MKAFNNDNDPGACLNETFVMPPKYFIRSKYCGTYVKNTPAEFEEAETEKEKLNKEAIELGFSDVQFELVEA